MVVKCYGYRVGNLHAANEAEKEECRKSICASDVHPTSRPFHQRGSEWRNGDCLGQRCGSRVYIHVASFSPVMGINSMGFPTCPRRRSAWRSDTRWSDSPGPCAGSPKTGRSKREGIRMLLSGSLGAVGGLPLEFGPGASGRAGPIARRLLFAGLCVCAGSSRAPRLRPACCALGGAHSRQFGRGGSWTIGLSFAVAMRLCLTSLIRRCQPVLPLCFRSSSVLDSYCSRDDFDVEPGSPALPLSLAGRYSSSLTRQPLAALQRASSLDASGSLRRRASSKYAAS